MGTGTAVYSNRRRSIFAPILAVAWAQARWCISLIRTAMLIFWATALVEMLIARQLWIALFNGRTVYEGYTIDQTLSYVVLSMAIFGLLRGDPYMYWMIRSGNVLLELIHPLRYTTRLMAFSLASIFMQLLLQAAPQLLMAVFILKIPLPASLSAWLVFAFSFLLGCMIFNCIEILISMMAFWTTEMVGLVRWKDIIVGILSGAALPLWIFPAGIERVISWLPFRAMQYVPLSILVGWIKPERYAREMLIQAGWVVLLWLAVEGVYELAMKRYEIQGG
jgi:ABC-2 type transport system permease protein